MHPELKNALISLLLALGIVILPIAVPILGFIYKSWVIIVAGVALYFSLELFVHKKMRRASDPKVVGFKKYAWSVLFVLGILLLNLYYSD
ncbi:hypothetical protein ACCI51_09390 [Microbulbifer echini]|uniref:Uncharacterized protein n=1 Tax=Microbulbifer echini TaxID=1529067 RepID=A0ABV4NMI3_9GAMM